MPNVFFRQFVDFTEIERGQLLLKLLLPGRVERIEKSKNLLLIDRGKLFTEICCGHSFSLCVIA